MIRRGKVEGWLRLEQDAFLPWATFNEVVFHRTMPGTIPNRGGSLLARQRLDADEDDSNVLLIVPQDLILSLERCNEHANVDKDYREVLHSLDDLGRVGLHNPSTIHVQLVFQVGFRLTYHQTPRGAILTFLLVQSSMLCPDLRARVSVHTPFLEYVHTFYDAERQKLRRLLPYMPERVLD